MRDIASIIGLKVFSSKEGREVGTVSQAIVSLSSGALEGLIVGKGPSEKGIAASDIEVIGSDAVMVSTYRVARHLSELPGLMERRRDPAAGPREVLTAAGKRLGVLSTVYIDPVNKRVTRYEVSGGAWRDITEGVICLAPMEGTVDGRDSVVVPSAAIAATPGEGGLKQQLAKLGELAKSQAQQAAESLSETGDSVKKGWGGVVGAAKTLAQSAQDKAPDAQAPASATSVASPQAETPPSPTDEQGQEPCAQEQPPAEEQHSPPPEASHEGNGWETSQPSQSDEYSGPTEGDEQHNG